MLEFVRRLGRVGELLWAMPQERLLAANNLLKPYGIELEPAWCNVPPAFPHRPIEVLEAVGSATVTALGGDEANQARRLAQHWGLVRYVADLAAVYGVIRVSEDGQRYRTAARGAFSGDLGMAWSAMALQQHLAPGCAFLDVDHVGATLVQQGPLVRQLNGSGHTTLRPDFVAVDAADSATVDLVEAKGTKRPLPAERLARAALQLYGLECAAKYTLRHRYVTTIHGERTLHVAVFRAREGPLGFDPSGRQHAAVLRRREEVDEEVVSPEQNAESEWSQSVAESGRYRTVDEGLVDGLRWLAGRGLPEERVAPEASAATSWDWEGEEFEGLVTSSQLDGWRLTIRDGVSSEVLNTAEQGEDVLRRSREARTGVLDRLASRRRAHASRNSRGGVFEAESSVMAVGDLGTVLEVEIEQ